jgi:hypothetical protein
LPSGFSQAQTLTYGLVVGTSLTSDFGKRTFSFINPVNGGVNYFEETPASKGFIIGGGLIEYHFSRSVSLDVNALYRALHYNQTQYGTRDTVVTWQLPMLLKYSFKPAAILHPFAEAGPAFRATGNLNSTSPSHTGLCAGVGLAAHLGFLDVAPGLRYTRWRSDTRSALYFSKSDQLELLVDLTHSSKFRFLNHGMGGALIN